jgi:hypothetical protein
MSYFARCLCIAILFLFIANFKSAAVAEDASTDKYEAFAFKHFWLEAFDSTTTLYSKSDIGFEGLSFETDTFLVNDLFHMVEFRRVGENFSMGVTKRGLKLCIDW